MTNAPSQQNSSTTDLTSSNNATDSSTVPTTHNPEEASSTQDPLGAGFNAQLSSASAMPPATSASTSFAAFFNRFPSLPTLNLGSLFNTHSAAADDAAPAEGSSTRTAQPETSTPAANDVHHPVPTAEIRDFYTALYNELSRPPTPISDLLLIQRAQSLEQEGNLLDAAYTYYVILKTLTSHPSNDPVVRFATASQALARIVQDPRFRDLSIADQNQIYFTIGYGMLNHYHLGMIYRQRGVYFVDTYLEQIATCFAMSHRLNPPQPDYVGVLLAHLRNDSHSDIAAHSTALLLLLVEKLLIIAAPYKGGILNNALVGPLNAINAACAVNKTFCEQFAQDSDGHLLYDGTTSSLLKVVCTHDARALLPKRPSPQTGLRAFHQRPERSEPHEAYRPAANTDIAPALGSKEAMLATLPEQQIPLAIQNDDVNSLKHLVQIWLWRETQTLFVSASGQVTPQSIPFSSSNPLPGSEPSSSLDSTVVPASLTQEQQAGSSSNTGFFSSSWSLTSFLSSHSTTNTPIVPETVNLDVLTMMRAQLKNWIQEALTAEQAEFAKALYQYLLCITPGNELISYIREPAQAPLWQVIQMDIWTFHAFLSNRLLPDAWSEGSAKRAPAQRLIDSLATAVGLDQLGTIGLNAQRPHLTLWQLIHEFKQQHPQDYQTLFDRQGLGTLLVTTLSDTAKELEHCYEVSAKGQYAPALALMTRLQALTPAQPQEADANHTHRSPSPSSSSS